MKVSLAQKKRGDRKGPQPVYIRLSHLGKEAFVSLGIAIHPRDWNARQGSIRASHRDADALSGLLSAQLARAQRAAAELVLMEGRTVTVVDVKDAVTRAVHPERVEVAQPVPILPWMRAEVERHYAGRGKVSTALAYGSALNNFETGLVAQGLRPDALAADGLTLPVLLTHRDRLERPTAQGGEGHAPNYVHKQITTLRALLERADRAGVPGAEVALKAAKNVDVRKERTERVRLTIEQVRGYYGALLTGRSADVRDWWCFAFYAGGVRLSDVCRLRWRDVVRSAPPDDAPDGTPGPPVGYRMRTQKTGAPTSLPLSPEAAAIVVRWQARTLLGDEASPYVFGLLDEADEMEPARLRTAVGRRGSLARKYLAAEGTARGWPKIGSKTVGFHTARHSLADHLRRSGVSVYDISKVLTQTRISTTEQYLAGFDELTVGAALLGALNSDEA